jgi:sterol carrier protein 2
MATDSVLAFDPTAQTTSCIELAGADMTRRAARDLFSATSASVRDVQVVELHDCFSANEVLSTIDPTHTLFFWHY